MYKLSRSGLPSFNEEANDENNWEDEFQITFSELVLMFTKYSGVFRWGWKQKEKSD